VFHDPDRARSAFGLRADYNELVIRLTERLAREANVLLVPHVNTPPGHYESDPAACEAVRCAVCERSPEAAPHVAVAPVCEDPCEIKDLIARCDWFCGTRMHSTIAALSSGVPTAAIAYSLKTAPVFATCDQEDEVVDPREHGEHDLVEALLSSFARRAELRSSLARRLPTVVAAAEECMDTIVDRVLGRATPAEMEHR
jgi:colanic acid/amylovoran biosynthesis protein